MVGKEAPRDRESENAQIIFVFHDGEDTFCFPYVDCCVGDHASTAASRGTAERAGMINKETL